MIAAPVFALLHGGAQGSWVWTDLASRLRQREAAVILLDVPGCGIKRHVDTIAYNVDDVVEELVGELAGHTTGPITLVGHSQAGTLLPQIWRHSPALFNRLIYLSCCAPLPGQSVVDMMGYDLQGAHEDQVGWPLDPATHGKDELRQLMFCNDMGSAQAQDFMHLLDHDNWPPGVTYAAHWSYDRLTDCPSSYVLCERDTILPPDWQRRFAVRLACQRTLSIDAGHQAMVTRPDVLAQLLLAEAGH